MKKTLKTLCMTVFEITMPLFILVGITLVLIQTMAIFSGNGSPVGVDTENVISLGF